MQNNLTLVLGGAASGKSAWAEGFIENQGLPMLYLATSQAFDAEMKAKIAMHLARRGRGWTTREIPLDLADALAELHAGQAVLVDCATMWLSNQMLAERDLAAATDQLISAASTCRAALCIVSNEVGQGIVPDNQMARQFREAQGRLNIRLAAAATKVVQVVAGLPIALKGSL
ncbi:bifunctional adenosylcobinamide kinase/adenosylcobinamide-phosphate guanylyltransferase [Pseudooceanicola sp.]|uniref:bifunctional adenosylcobinamide kinase/adenosylcobinamide-phosphate guanylyltransferase n=1 Tax=Pseudooceanicola sp. TaxID=1914328 RepID=UPI00260D0BA0|nr:bifunctional adenosylcobinamide kinase/adenosylcobinamide-phosphate guanylyltransferase [Pseudooceanicola sp.]MDF1854630.1 bifunctional adenosylcobinamide kinase/adenosylcobinamide-phosphate guanylyltransferase [Pseudooceanicola sp.]